MYHSRKRPRRTAAGASWEDREGEVCDNSRGIDALDDMLPNILSYLRLREIMCTRRVNKTWTAAVSKTTVSPEIFLVETVKTYSALRVMSTVLPNLLSIGNMPFMNIIRGTNTGVVDNHRKYNDGEDPDEEQAARTANFRTYDLEILANFRKLRNLNIDYYAPLNGRYPFLFNFPLLQKLSITCRFLKWDLGALTGLPMLKELNIRNYPTGNISSLRVLKDTLEKVTLRGCSDVEGNFMILADFPQLKMLELVDTSVTVDIGDIASDDFPKLEELFFGRNQSVSGNIRSLRVLKDTLRELTLEDCPNVDGNFMALADFPQLRSLHLDNSAVTVDIGDLVNGDFARLEELLVFCGNPVSGNIRNLRVIKDTLKYVTIAHSVDVEGNIMDLADFPQLRVLGLDGTAVTGDIREIGEDDFSKIEELELPSTIYGGQDYEFQRISDAPELMRALYLLKKQHPSLTLKDWSGRLSQDSPDWYDCDEELDEDEDYVSSPFCISLVEAGTRIGYRWKDDLGEEHCEVNWLDPVPDEESSDYEEFLDELQKIEIEQGDFYKGYHQPPTEEEYNRLIQEWRLGRERRARREISYPGMPPQVDDENDSLDFVNYEEV